MTHISDDTQNARQLPSDRKNLPDHEDVVHVMTPGGTTGASTKMSPSSPTLDLPFSPGTSATTPPTLTSTDANKLISSNKCSPMVQPSSKSSTATASSNTTSISPSSSAAIASTSHGCTTNTNNFQDESSFVHPAHSTVGSQPYNIRPSVAQNHWRETGNINPGGFPVHVSGGHWMRPVHSGCYTGAGGGVGGGGGGAFRPFHELGYRRNSTGTSLFSSQGMNPYIGHGMQSSPMYSHQTPHNPHHLHPFHYSGGGGGGGGWGIPPAGSPPPPCLLTPPPPGSTPPGQLGMDCLLDQHHFPYTGSEAGADIYSSSSVTSPLLLGGSTGGGGGVSYAHAGIIAHPGGAHGQAGGSGSARTDPLSPVVPPREGVSKSDMGVGPPTPPSPTTPDTPPRLSKRTRFLHPAGADTKSPTAGSLEPNREGGWGWVVLLTATLSHTINGGIAIASPVIIPYIKENINGTTTLQAALVVSSSWGVGSLLSPVIAAMTLKYGSRSLCALGGFIAALGALFNSFSEEVIHLFISFSIIFSLGLAMSDQASRIALRSYFRKTHRGKFRLYQGTVYVGALIFAYSIHSALEDCGWMRGLQVITASVASNFVLGLFLTKPRVPHRSHTACRKMPHALSLSYKDCFGWDILKEPCIKKWLAIEGTAMLVIRSPLLLMVIHPVMINPETSELLLPHSIMLWSGCAVAGVYIWRMSKRWLPVSPLLFLREQLLLSCVVVILMGLTTSLQAFLLSTAGLGLLYGGLESSLTLQVGRIVTPAQRNCMESWAACVRGFSMLVGAPLAVCVSEWSGQAWAGYLFCGIVYVITVFILLMFMGSIRGRELDMAPPMSPQRPPILLEVTPAPSQPMEDLDFELNPGKLHPGDIVNCEDNDLPPGGCVGGVGGLGGDRIGDSTLGNGVVLGYLGEEQVRSMDAGDYRWARLISTMDPYSRRMLLCHQGYDNGEEYAEAIGHPRKRGYSEPALPVLQECPSQENSSLSRADNSILSLGLKDSGDGTSLRAEGCSLINTSFANDEFDSSDDKTSRSLPRKMSDNSLFKADRVPKGLMTGGSSGGGSGGSGCSGGAGGGGSRRRLSLGSEVSPPESPLMCTFTTSRGTSTDDEELKLLDNDATKSYYGATQEQCAANVKKVGSLTNPEALVETTV